MDEFNYLRIAREASGNVPYVFNKKLQSSYSDCFGSYGVSITLMNWQLHLKKIEASEERHELSWLRITVLKD